MELGTRTIPEDQYIYDFSFPQAGGDPNPHLWTDPVYAGDYARIIADELTTLDPENGDSYRTNQGAFKARIDQLDGMVRAVTETVPPQNGSCSRTTIPFPTSRGSTGGG